MFYRFLSPITGAWTKRGFFDAESVEVLVEGAVPSPPSCELDMLPSAVDIVVNRGAGVTLDFVDNSIQVARFEFVL